MADAAEPGDLVARLGGDEFAVLCRGVRGRDDVFSRAERIRSSAQPARESGPAAGVTLSIGAAESRPGTAPTELLREADRALYRAKRAGKNRVVLADR